MRLDGLDCVQRFGASSILCDSAIEIPFVCFSEQIILQSPIESVHFYLSLLGTHSGKGASNPEKLFLSSCQIGLDVRIRPCFAVSQTQSDHGCALKRGMSKFILPNSTASVVVSSR